MYICTLWTCACTCPEYMVMFCRTCVLNASGMYPECIMNIFRCISQEKAGYAYRIHVSAAQIELTKLHPRDNLSRKMSAGMYADELRILIAQALHRLGGRKPSRRYRVQVDALPPSPSPPSSDEASTGSPSPSALLELTGHLPKIALGDRDAPICELSLDRTSTQLVSSWPHAPYA